MKNYFKKFSIIFVMALAIMGVVVIQNGSVANATVVGENLNQAEAGWTRCNDTDSNITYVGKDWKAYSSSPAFKGDLHYTDTINNTSVRFNFTGNKIRIINQCNSGHSESIDVYIDGVKVNNHSINTSSAISQVLKYEINNLSSGEHYFEYKYVGKKQAVFDAVDIDSNGVLKPYNENIKEISLDKSSMSINMNDSKKLTATTTPADAQVTWTSSDTSVATVDSTGKVTAIKEGQAMIIAQITGSETKATCTVNVTKGEEAKPPVDEPTEPTGDGKLFIELVDGQIKQYDVSNDEITKFKNWFVARDNTKSELPYYEFKKGSYKDFVVHDKIDWFEVR